MKLSFFLVACFLVLAACEGRNPAPALGAPASEAVAGDVTPEYAGPAFAPTADGL